MAQQELDHLSGQTTTGHEWDGLKELNTPLPKWWLYVFYACIVWSIGYWVVMPAWPLLTDYTRGIWGHSQRQQVVADLRTRPTVVKGALQRPRLEIGDGAEPADPQRRHVNPARRPSPGSR